MTEKWLSLTPNPPRIPIFYTLTKIHKPIPVGRPIISGCEGPTERISSFVDNLLQPIAKAQKSYLKDTTHFINFIENTKVTENTVLVSMDVTSLYTNIPQEEGINTVCIAYEKFYGEKPPIPSQHLREMLRKSFIFKCLEKSLSFKKILFNLTERIISKLTEPQWEQKWQLPLQISLCLRSRHAL